LNVYDAPAATVTFELVYVHVVPLWVCFQPDGS